MAFYNSYPTNYQNTYYQQAQMPIQPIQQPQIQSTMQQSQPMNSNLIKRKMSHNIEDGIIKNYFNNKRIK